MILQNHNNITITSTSTNETILFCNKLYACINNTINKKYKLKIVNRILQKFSIKSLFEANKTSEKTSKISVILLLNGDLGVGKTFIASNVIKMLLNDHNIAVASPTFNIVNVYNNAMCKKQINHYDLYRIKLESELDSIGFYESLLNSVSLIEWSDIASNYITKFVKLNKNVIIYDIKITQNENQRNINFTTTANKKV